MIQIKEIIVNADFNKGIFLIKPAAEKEYRAQVSINIAIAIALTGAVKVPAFANSTMYCGALALLQS